MPIPTAAELTDPNATNTQMKQRLGQLAENVAPKEKPFVRLNGVAGSSVAYTADLPAGVTAYEDNQVFLFAPHVSSSGAITLNIGGLGALPIVTKDVQQLQAGDLKASNFYLVRVSAGGTQFRLLEILPRDILSNAKLQGAPTAPKPNSDDNSDRIPTTSFVEDRSSRIEQAASLIDTCPNLISSAVYNFLSTSGVTVGTGTSLVAGDYYGIPCFIGTNPIGVLNPVFQYKIPVSRLNGATRFSASINILELTAGGSAQSRVLVRQFTDEGGTSEINSARQTYVITSNGEALTQEKRIKFRNLQVDPNAKSISLYLDLQHTSTSIFLERKIYFREMLICAGANAEWREAERDKLTVSYLPDSTFEASINGNTGTGAFSIVGGELIITPSANNPSRIYELEATGPLAPGNTLQCMVDAMSDKVAGAQLDLMFFNAAGTEVTPRVTVKNTITASYETLRASGLVPANTVTIRFRVVCWFSNAPNSTYAKFKLPALVATSSAVKATSTIPKPVMIGVGHLNTYVSPTGSDTTGDGSIGNPFATPARALSKMTGVGDLILLAGQYGSQKLDGSRIKDINIVGMSNAGFQRPEFTYGTKLTGVIPVSGKVFKVSITLAGQHNILWQDAVADVQTLALPNELHAGLRGRLHRLEKATAIKRTTATTRSNAILEIESSTDPRCFYDASANELLFSVAGGDAMNANVYITSASDTLFSGRSTSILTPTASIVRISGIDVKYGSINNRGLAHKTFIEDCSIFGAYTNALDLALYSEIKAIEVCGAGSGITSNGDGMNWHDNAICVHDLVYTHDNWDDGMSSHENCIEHGSRSISEYNGGGGFTPAYGAQATYRDCISRKNNGVTSRFNTGKVGGFEAHKANEGLGTDISLLTSVEAYNCISIGDRHGFYDYWYKENAQSYMKTYNCTAIDPILYGFACLESLNPSHIGTGVGKAPERDGRNVVVKNTTLVT